MDKRYKEIRNFAEQSLGEMPQVIDLLFKLDENSAIEQFDQNQSLYLGRSSLSIKTRVLIAMSVALANGPKESAMIHYKLARRFGVDPLEIVDAMRATKMALMSSTLDSIDILIDQFGDEKRSDEEEEGIKLLLDGVKSEADAVPERVIMASHFSSQLVKEHLREKKAMLKPIRLTAKEMYAIAFAVSSSIRDRECERVYLGQFAKNGGTRSEAEDILATTRFLVGNRSFVNGLDVLKTLTSQ
ncbi:carboxymuconolactone decarboxylase family protein [Thermoplasma sp.]|uniref:carboxymuconolactone decarboxylase family protein n=1 Tax=Thermoplasma sp. TaxID=1973142 RepID=UPI00126DB640|nr:carboxymuconolactone decarboxylase family protein [Thermoplasma sp.]KAA8921927.1 MAG: carboxymuconolactone decarboxylase family protein [Thermoplasma sp.]